MVYAELTDTTATAEFLEQLPFTVDMHEHLDRQKEVYLPFSLSEESQQDTVYKYEIGDIVYWHPGPTMGIFTEHDGRDISSGIEVLAKMDERSGLENRKFYLIATAADGKSAMERTVDGLRVYLECLPGAKEMGVIYGAGAWQPGGIQGNPAMQEAYRMGKNI